MARLIEKDYERLILFFAQYSLSGLTDSKIREQLIKKGHKYCLSSLQIWAMAENWSKQGKLQISGKNFAQNSPQLDQISESFSDLTSAYFSTIHGLTKPAHMSLRSSIETFVRGLAGSTSIEASNTTSVYRLFELARTCAVFQGLSTQHFNALHQEYVDLCNVSHSANAVHLIKNHAMSNFPKQDIEKLRIWVRHCEVIVKAMISIMILGNRDFYTKATPWVQDVLDETISKEIRLFALNAPIQKK